MNKLDVYLKSRTAAALARDAGISPAFVSELRKGTRQPSLRTMQAIHRATDGAVTFTDWVPEQESPHG